MAVLGPVFVIYFVLGLEFERLKAFASLPLDALLFAFGQFAAYRARRYRLTCTVWRGVRFWMTGSGWSDAWRSVLWGLLLIPILSAALERYKLGHTLYGSLPGRFEATGPQFFKKLVGLVARPVAGLDGPWRGHGCCYHWPRKRQAVRRGHRRHTAGWPFPRGPAVHAFRSPR
jgi:uncharacterized membrane protein YjgN (DUF898 family)